MANARGITDLQIFGSSGPRDSRRARRRNPGIGGRLLKNKARALPRLELLEGRMLLTTYTVTSTGTADVAGTLLYAINQLNSERRVLQYHQFQHLRVRACKRSARLRPACQRSQSRSPSRGLSVQVYRRFRSWAARREAARAA